MAQQIISKEDESKRALMVAGEDREIGVMHKQAEKSGQSSVHHIPKKRKETLRPGLARETESHGSRRTTLRVVDEDKNE